jgi:hypothetical protein
MTMYSLINPNWNFSAEAWSISPAGIIVGPSLKDDPALGSDARFYGFVAVPMPPVAANHPGTFHIADNLAVPVSQPDNRPPSTTLRGLNDRGQPCGAFIH